MDFKLSRLQILFPPKKYHRKRLIRITQTNTGYNISCNIDFTSTKETSCHFLTLEQAEALCETRVWLSWTPKQVVRYQLFQNIVFIEASHFIVCAQKVIGFIHYDDLTNREDWNDLIYRYRLKYPKVPTAGEVKQLLGDKAYLVGL
jgi:hypothetical protein